jgi:RNA polymerase sigma-70 factor (ECF subfamily)
MDQNEFHKLVSTYQDSVAGVIYRLIHSQEDARDLMQDAFIQLWKHHQKLDNQHAALTYLYRTAVHLAIDRLRRKKHGMVELTPEVEQLNAGMVKDSRELFEAIMVSAKWLKPKQKAVFILRDVEGFEFEEIAVLLNIPLANLRSNLHLARKKIKEILKKYYNITTEYWYDL